LSFSNDSDSAIDYKKNHGAACAVAEVRDRKSMAKGEIVRTMRFHIVLGCWLIAGAVPSGAQTQSQKITTRRAGLWEITTTITWQRSPFEPGKVKGIADGDKHTKLVCLSQEMIDSYGALLPQSRGDCHIENKVMRPGGITADWVCTGKINGKGELATNWIDLEHATGKLHFWGTFQGGPDTFPIEWTTESSSVFKSEDCGNMRPSPVPPNTQH
jgi:hypothetical protein